MMRVKSLPVRHAAFMKHPRRRARPAQAAAGGAHGRDPSGPPSPGSGASAKVYWPGGLSQLWAGGDSPTWTTDDWEKMLTPDLNTLLSAYSATSSVVTRFVDEAEHYTKVVESDVTGLSVDDYVVLVNDRGEVHYADWVIAGLDPAVCPWRANVECWGVHGPVIIMPRSSYP